MKTDAGIEDLLRQMTPQVLAAVVRHYGDFEAAEDAVQEALLAAATQWPSRGVPGSPQGWLIKVASRRMTDQLRSELARRRRETTAASLALPDEFLAAPADSGDLQGEDDTLALLLLCCHPALTPASQIALTLRAVGGLTTAQIARAFLVPETTMLQRISRAKQRIKAAGARFRMPPEPERAERLRAVLHVLYLIFNEGYTTTSGPHLQRGELTGEAIRLARAVHTLLPGDGEVAGLLALMLLPNAAAWSMVLRGVEHCLARLIWSRRPLRAWNRNFAAGCRRSSPVVSSSATRCVAATRAGNSDRRSAAHSSSASASRVRRRRVPRRTARSPEPALAR